MKQLNGVLQSTQIGPCTKISICKTNVESITIWYKWLQEDLLQNEDRCIVDIVEAKPLR